MVEMLGVLAIIGVLGVAGIAGYTTALNKHKAKYVDVLKRFLLSKSFVFLLFTILYFLMSVPFFIPEKHEHFFARIVDLIVPFKGIIFLLLILFYLFLIVILNALYNYFFRKEE